MSKKKSRRRDRIEPHVLPVEERGLDPVDGECTMVEVNLGYLSKEEVLEEIERCYECKKPRCVEGCPAHCDIPNILKAFREGEVDKALEYIHSVYCFPRTLHRICPAFCQEACTAGKKGDPIQTLCIVRYIVDNYEKPEQFFETAPPTGKKVAIIGSGCAGLTAAYYLAKLGHEATIYEKAKVVGGMLTLGIPEYRLPTELIFSEVEDIKKVGVKIELGKEYGKDFDSKKLFEMGYDAILISHGAHKPKWMGIPGEDLEGSIHVIDFLRDVALGKKPKIGKKVAVIGGGDSAIDAVRTARRLGADSFIIYRRSKEQMPATKGEIHETEAEGIPIYFLRNPVEILGKDGKIVGIKVIKMKLGEPDASGRARPIPIEGSEYVLEADTMIQAISQEPQYDFMEKEGFKMTRWHTFEVDPETNMTSIEGVFAAGDNVSGPLTAIAAIADAHKAVKSIHEYIMKK